ncbi:type I restriction endonuclease subunit R [Candidatus Dependentiae bacterium]|nr:type I restriction endonuclease subunit R [Candidatus Dependentiae bacterium]
MSELPSFLEDHISQVPALQLLIKLGYEYISPEDAYKERRGKSSQVILENILESQLHLINKFTYNGKTRKFSNNNVTEAIETLKRVPFDGLIRTSKNIYDLLIFGKSFAENLPDGKKSFNFKYIDWVNPENNVYHVTEEFEVEKFKVHGHRRPDIILFINGIPFVVIECKRPDLKAPLKEAISQQIRNQREDEIPQLFIFSQILLTLTKNEGRYASVGAPERFWFQWRESEQSESSLEDLVNQPLSTEQKDVLFSKRFRYVRQYFDQLESKGREVTSQDRLIYSLCSHSRLLELSRKFIVFDGAEKKIARYQQYFSIKETLIRIKTRDENGKRNGGVIWHTQGSGKSLTMVMLATALALEPEIENPRLIIVTDRILLDEQLSDTFERCEMKPHQATSGVDLFESLANNRKTIITTVLKKFEAGLNKQNLKIDDPNIFVLVDESHKSIYGILGAKMYKILPRACFIGFTGTPLMKKEKNTAMKFGGFIHTYLIDQAIKDKAVVPLLYEGRVAIQNVQKDSVDKWFNRVCEPLNEYQTADLKKKFSRIEKIYSSDQTTYCIAFDISNHYSMTWKDTGFKAQLATASKDQALKFKKFLDEIGQVTSDVIISGPDEREGYEDIYDETKSEIKKFWDIMMQKYGSEKEYNRKIKFAFENHDEPEILIVVDKLLTGFDCPPNTVLYLVKNLKEHNLLQAIARVNRIYEGKEFGFIIDYMGLLGELNEALVQYSALENFEEADLEGILNSINTEVKNLPQRYAELWDLFKIIKNKLDEEEYELLLKDEELRLKFYQKLNAFSRTLGIALSSVSFYDTCQDSQIKKYKDDLLFFQRLRHSVRHRYAESIDYKEFEPKIKKLLDTYVTADDILVLGEPVNIYDKEKFEAEVSRIEGDAARADTIAYRTLRSIKERFEEDPVFYQKFSDLIKKAIEDYRVARINEAEYLKEVTEGSKQVREGKSKDTPKILWDKEVARAFYGIVNEVLIAKNLSDPDSKPELAAEIGIKIDEIILKNKIVDFHLNQDIQNRMINQIEDYLLDDSGINFSYDDVDIILASVMKIAIKKYGE